MSKPKTESEWLKLAAKGHELRRKQRRKNYLRSGGESEIAFKQKFETLSKSEKTDFVHFAKFVASQITK